MKHDVLAKDIIAKTPAARPQAVLAFTGFHAFQFSIACARVRRHHASHFRSH